MFAGIKLSTVFLMIKVRKNRRSPGNPVNLDQENA